MFYYLFKSKIIYNFVNNKKRFSLWRQKNVEDIKLKLVMKLVL